jgi:hypothetical protein
MSAAVSCQPESPDSSSTNAVSFSPARTQRNACRCRDVRQQQRLSALHDLELRPPKLQPALLRLSAMISQYFMRPAFSLFCTPQGNDKMIFNGRNEAGPCYLIPPVGLIWVTAVAAPLVTYESPCECRDNHGKHRWSEKNDPSLPPTDASAIQAVTPSDIFNWKGPTEHLMSSSQPSRLNKSGTLLRGVWLTRAVLSIRP